MSLDQGAQRTCEGEGLDQGLETRSSKVPGRAGESEVPEWEG